MKISLSWLQDFIDLKETNPQKLADRLTEATGEIDDVVMQSELLNNCCVGKVASLKKHPNADRLSLCDVETDKGTKKVVCGGTNLKDGMLVAFAHIGAVVKWHGEEMMTLAPVKIRGEQSEGMICAAEELGLESQFPSKPTDGEHPIINLSNPESRLPAEASAKVGIPHPAVGTPLAEALGMTDTVFHIDNHAITHRADLFSHMGVAGELVALNLAKWKESTKQKTAGTGRSSLIPRASMLPFAKTPLTFKCINDIPDLIPRYCSALITLDAIPATPDWMKRRLEATGWRSISLPVDITNYVSMELGMPLHSFDAGDLKGDVHMRTAKKGEKITTLDGVERALPDGAIVLSDDAGIFDLLGIMGGLRSSTKDSTKTIYLHSAIVDPASIRRTIIATGHRTDASTVYEKGIPRVVCEQGFLRALGLLLELAPTAKIVSKMESWGDDGKAQAIELDADHVRSVIGIDITDEKIAEILESLECHVKKEPRTKNQELEKIKDSKLKAQSSKLSVTPPLHRLGDLKGAHDLVEEVARIIGYNSIKPAIPHALTALPPRDFRRKNLRQALKEQGFMEMLNLAFASSDHLKKFGFDPTQAVQLQNPIGAETAYMRMSLLPALALSAAENIEQVDEVLKSFEIGHVFSKDKESHQLCMFAASRHKTTLKTNPLLALKTDVTSAFKAIGYEISVTQTVVTLRDAPLCHAEENIAKRSPSRSTTSGAPQGDNYTFKHPGRSAEITIDKKVIGSLFELHPALIKALGLPDRAGAAIIDWEAVEKLAPQTKLFKHLPTFPAISYDETVPIFKVQAAAVLANLKKADALLESVQIIDLYEANADKRMTLRFTYRAADRTLAQEETDTVHGKVLSELQKAPR